MLGNNPINTQLFWLKQGRQAVHLAYPKILCETTVPPWSTEKENNTLSLSHKLPCEGFMLFIPSLFDHLVQDILSLHLSILKSQMSTFQSNPEGLFQVLSPPQKAFLPCLLQSTNVTCLSELAYSFSIPKIQYLTVNSHVIAAAI